MIKRIDWGLAIGLVGMATILLLFAIDWRF